MQIKILGTPHVYLAGGIVIGFFQIIDGLLAVYEIRNNLTTAFSLFELCWFVYSLFMLLVFQREKHPLLAPVLFLAYYTLSWLYGTYLLHTEQLHGTFAFPGWFAWLATGFGCIYMLTSYRTLKKQEQSRG